MKFTRRWTSSFCLFLLPLALYSGEKIKKEDRQKHKMEKVLQTLPDSLYERVRREDLLQNEVYVKLARDGWNNQEIVRIMDNYLQYRKSKVKGSHAYGMYAKQWLPTYGYTPGGDSIYQFVDTTFSEKAIASVRRLYSKSLDNYYPQIPYTPDDRLKGIRNTGYFRPVLQYPNTGRIHWIVADPLNADHIMVVPDGGGIFRTDNLGDTWDCVTDRIPDREFRKICAHSAIPVDPDDWNHFFAFMKYGNATRVYETVDGGQNWTRIEGATHKNFKRGYGFKDKAGNLKFIGAWQAGNYMYNELWTSADKGKSWDRITLPEELKETHPENGSKGAFFQNFAFNPQNRDMVYIPTSRSIYYFDDGVTKNENGGYNIKKMVFDVYDQDGTTLRAKAVSEFPFKATTQGFLEIDPAHPDTMWFASASRNVSYGVYSAVYKTMDGGKTWITLQEPLAKIGSGLAFGNESPWGWLGGFGVNFKNPQRLYGCSMSSAISTDGGKNFWEYAWGNRLKAKYTNGNYYVTTSSRHNADNHCIVSHPSGRVFRGSDSGVLMIDENINGHQWTNINGPMGNQLHYSIKVNEFGDQVMLGNTQDVDVQTYKYGRWENWRGYEGTEAFINPYGGTCYFSGSGGGGLDGIDFGSWRAGYTKADVCTGNWYLMHNQDGGSFYRIEDFGRTPINISTNTADDTGAGAGVNDFALSRGKDGTPVIYVYNKNNTVVRSVDNGNTFQTVKVNVSSGLVNAKYANCKIATDPNDVNIVYLGQNNGKVFKINAETHTVEEISTGLPSSISCKGLLFHEGSGDLYYCGSAGIYLLEKGSNSWRLWMDGYNPLEYGSALINYTTQEMVIHDYGRGIWVADLEHPSDRFFADGFALKEISDVDGRKTIGIDTKWTIPMYYEYTWTVNGVEQHVPYQYLTARLNPGDRVQLKLTLRESPDVSTTSAEFTVPDASRQKDVAAPVYALKAGKALYSDGSGRVDLGYVDYFYNNFTIDFWIKAESDGVILANRPVDIERDTRGWAILLENGQLKFRYAPANMVNQPSYEQGFTQQGNLVIGSFQKNKWNHVALSQDRYGNVVLYLNGNTTAQQARILPNHTLNSSLYLSLFADGYERRAIKAAVDELRIWKSAYGLDEIRRIMYSHDPGHEDDLLYYQDFNAGKLDAEQELFSRQGMRVRTRAVTSYVAMPIGVAARWADLKEAASDVTFASGSKQLLKLHMDQYDQLGTLAAYEYDLQGSTQYAGVDSKYYEVASDIYQIRSFGTVKEGIQADLYFPQALDDSQRYTLYASDFYADSVAWNKLAVLEKDASTGQFVARGIPMSTIQGRQLVILKNKAAIEVAVGDASWDNTLVVYDKNETQFKLRAEAIAGLSEPTGTYKITSEKGYLIINDDFNFQNDVAEGTVSVDMRRVGDAVEVSDRLIGQDGRMIPVSVKVINKVMPENVGNASTITSGGMIFENASLPQKLNGTNQMTFMGWVRIDNANLFSGVNPLIFSRSGGSKVCGLHLSGGNLGFHWNDGYYGWKSSFTLTTADVGRWVHVAMSVAPDGVRIYLNGMEYHNKLAPASAQIESMLMLGVDSRNDRRFNGAFDQVSIWGRTLSADEIRQYMYHAPKLNAESLLAYVDMDSLSASGQVIDRVSGLPMTNLGTVRQEQNMGSLYNPTRELVQETADTENGQTFFLEQPSNKKTRCMFAFFNGSAYNSTSAEHPELFPLVNRHYALTFSNLPGFTASETVRLIVNSPDQIAAGDHITLALRPMGRQTEYSSYIEAKTVEAGKAVFEIPGNIINGSVDFMLMTNTQVQDKPVKVALSAYDRTGTNAIKEGDLVILKEGENQFMVKTDVLSSNDNAQVLLTAVEQAYVKLNDTLDIKNHPQDEMLVTIDRSALDPFAENPVTLRLAGVSENTTLSFKVALEPVIQLSLLENQQKIENESQIVIDTVHRQFHVQVDLLQGVLKEGVPFVTEFDPKSKLKVNTNTQIGDLMANYAVTIKDHLEYHPSANPEDEGWNLVGNPYLHNLNLTKPQNVVIDESYVLKYMYQYEPETDTYRVWDMIENYDPTQQLKSLQPFFIQTKQQGATLTITPEAKNPNINRRVFSHYRMNDATAIRLSLLSEDKKEYDCTQVRVMRDAEDAYQFGEDAVKMWGGLNGQTNEIATQASGKSLSVNVVGSHQIEIPLQLKLTHTGTFELALSQQEGLVFTDKVQLYDKKLKVRHDLQSGRNYRFQVDAVAEANTRFALILSVGDEETGIEAPEEQKQNIQVGENGMCTISGLEGKSVIEVFDVAGRRIMYLPTTQESLSVRLKSGSYVLYVRSAQTEYSHKIVVK